MCSHDQFGETLREMWGKVRSCFPSSLGPAFLPQSLQRTLSCDHSERSCAHEKVVRLFSSHAKACGHLIGGQSRVHSITSSARASNVGGTSIPSALAVLRLMTNSNLVGCITGMSAGWMPFRIRPV